MGCHRRLPGGEVAAKIGAIHISLSEILNQTLVLGTMAALVAIAIMPLVI